MVVNKTSEGYVATVDGRIFPAAHTRKAAEAAASLYLRLKETAMDARGGQMPSPVITTLILDELINLLKD
jgi:hypothetical protein